MVVLSDRDIKKYLNEKKLVIVGLDLECIDPCSVDLKLSNKFRVFRNTEATHIDTRQGVNEELMEYIEKEEGKPFIVHPGELVLASTMEYVKLPNDLVGTLDGRSSLGRLGIVVHSTANSFDPGFEGNPTLEISNISRIPVAIWPGMRICRLSFTKLSSPVERNYGDKKGKYHKATSPDVSKIEKD